MGAKLPTSQSVTRCIPTLAYQGGVCNECGCAKGRYRRGVAEQRRAEERRGWCRRRSGEEEEVSAESDLRRAAASCCQLPNMVQEDGTLQGVELGGISRDLGEERIRHEDGRLVTMARIGVAKQG